MPPLQPPSMTPPPGSGPSWTPPPPKRNRQVHAPGLRGGNYRRVWSEKLHKFYIKYGKKPGALDVRNAHDDGPKREPNGATGQMDEQQIATPFVAKLDEKSTEELLNGIYEMLLKNYHEGPKGSGPKHGGHAVTFGKVTPANGEIVHGDNHVVNCFLYSETGRLLDNMKRRLKSQDKIKHFYCYMTARYAIKKFVDGKKEEEAKKSLFLRRSEGSDILKKAYAEVLIEKVSGPVTQPESAIPHESLQRLLKSMIKVYSPKSKPMRDEVGQHLDSMDAILDGMEKAGAKKPGEIWMRNVPYAGKRYGAIGSGSRTAFRRPGRPPGTGQGLTIASAQMTMESNAPKVPESKENWMQHRDLKIGARVKVQHPFDHQEPVWGRITNIGTHGVQVTDSEGNVKSIRWPHIHEIEPRVENTPRNAYEVARFSIPVQGTSTVMPHQMEMAEKMFRKLAMPLASDVIHAGHDDRNAAYKQMFSDDIPIDHVEATRLDEVAPRGLAQLTQSLIDHALSMQAPVDPALLKELPFERVIAVLHHHMNSRKEKKE